MMKLPVLLAIMVSAAAVQAETITDCRYMDASQSTIQCTVDGQTVFIPNAPGNRHRDQITAESIAIADPE